MPDAPPIGRIVLCLELEGVWTVHDTTEIPRESWNNFFARFSEDHETQFVSVERRAKNSRARNGFRGKVMTSHE